MSSLEDASGLFRRATSSDGWPTSSRCSATAFAGGEHGSADGNGLHRLLVDSVRDYAIFALDANGFVLSWNAGAESLKGYAPGEIIGRHFSVFYPPERIADGFPEHELEEARLVGRFEDEGWRVRKDGSRFWANVILTPLHDATGALVGFAKVTRDLTERWRAEVALRESEERFRLLVDGVRDYAIFMLDPLGVVASWNAGAEAIKGYRAEEIIGRHFSAFYPADDVAAAKPQQELLVAATAGRYEEEGWRLRKDGTSFWANVVITPLWRRNRELVGFAKVTRDLTERRAAQERVLADARRIAEAESASRTTSAFLAAMSHELRTPIHATIGYAELIAMEIRGPVNDAQRDDLERIGKIQHHLLGIVSGLLDYSRLQSGQVRYTIAPVPLHVLVENVLPMIAPQAMTKGLVVAHGPCSAEDVVLADRARTEQILLNLLANAVKFTPAGGRVTVSCGSTDVGVNITVADTGVGVASDQQAAIFEPFVQLGRTLTSGHEGTGLGLAISRDLARGMGGDVTVASTVGVGSTFTLTLRAGQRRPAP